MRIIFQNGEVAELTNINMIVVYNEIECEMLLHAASNFVIGAELEETWKSMKEETTNEQYPSSTEVCDGPVSEPDMAQEGSQHAGQTGIRDIPEEARGEGSPQAIGEFNWVDRFRKH